MERESSSQRIQIFPVLTKAMSVAFIAEYNLSEINNILSSFIFVLLFKQLVFVSV